ncbi:hypothetical protein AB1286_19275 [Trinickia sp. NRRL B-1857]|uniref:hypothetical protein n=1 Tax=Trinickia sp. NRRL B-1857 TaxID=3162879 RepID=UPI003D2E9582
MSLAVAMLAATLLCGACGKHPAADGESVASGTAASDTQAVAHSPDLKRANLMRTVFPAWEDTQKGDRRIVDVEVPNRDDHGRLTKTLGESRFDVSPREVVRLDDTHAVMLTEGVEVTDAGERDDSYASGAWLGAYFFVRQGSGWVLDKRIDGVDYGGVAGSYGESRVVRLSPSEFGLVLTSGGCWQGYCGSWASVYGISRGEVRSLVDTLRVAADNLGATEDCEPLLKNAAAPASGAATPPAQPAQPVSDVRDEAPDTPQCFNVVGKLEIAQGKEAPGDLRIAFTGAETVGKGKAVRDVDDVAVYRLKNGRYALSEGSNPVPAF